MPISDFPHYHSNGGGRDSYIHINNGGFQRTSGKSYELSLRASQDHPDLIILLPGRLPAPPPRKSFGLGYRPLSAQDQLNNTRPPNPLHAQHAERVAAQKLAAQRLHMALSSTGQVYSCARIQHNEPYHITPARPQTAFCRDGVFTRTRYRANSSRTHVNNVNPHPFSETVVSAPSSSSSVTLPPVVPSAEGREPPRMLHINNLVLTPTNNTAKLTHHNMMRGSYTHRV